MKLLIEDVQGKTVARIGGSMDTASAPSFQEEMESRLNQGDKNFVVEVAELEYITSAGLRAILAVAKKIKAAGGDICFCCLEGMVREVFEMSYFTQMFTIHDTLDQALAG